MKRHSTLLYMNLQLPQVLFLCYSSLFDFSCYCSPPAVFSSFSCLSSCFSDVPVCCCLFRPFPYCPSRLVLLPPRPHYLPSTDVRANIPAKFLKKNVRHNVPLRFLRSKSVTEREYLPALQRTSTLRRTSALHRTSAPKRVPAHQRSVTPLPSPPNPALPPPDTAPISRSSSAKHTPDSIPRI